MIDRFKYCLLVLCCFASGCHQNEHDKLTIATAANMQFAMRAIVQSFSKDSGIECDIIISSSGKLTAQIIEGAPYDVFVSADMKYPSKLFIRGFTTDKPLVYACGNLVLWTMKDGVVPDLSTLGSGEIRKIAVANPKTAPYGRAAMEVLKHLNLFESIEQKLVYGESIAQTNQFITTEAAEIGFTAKSVVLSPQINFKGKWVAIDSSYHKPIKQGVVILKNKNSRITKAQKFYNFLFSKEGKEILGNFGFFVYD